MNIQTQRTLLMDTTNLTGLHSEWLINDEMVAEEEKLEKDSADSLSSMGKQETYEPVIDQERFERFKKLLTHSQAYTEHLRGKMSTQIKMRRFERYRKSYLMRLQGTFYKENGIPYKDFLVDRKDFENDDSESEEAGNDPIQILNREMVNVKGEIVSMQQPFILENAVLRQYQLEGVHWLKVLYENGVNGILADEMGLGKTIQCISLLCHLIEMGISGPFMVVAPLVTLKNWLSEFHQFAPKVPLILYHGTPQDRRDLRKKITPRMFFDSMVCPVVLTSYGIVMKDRRHLEKFFWSYLAIDEGHRIKNFSCRLVRELKLLKTNSRLLLTGTPLQNNLSELWSLMNFLLPELFGDLHTFEMWFNANDMADTQNCDKIIQKEKEQQVLSTMHRILQPFILRRVKSDVAISIPPKKEILVYAPMSELQEKYYESTLNKTILKMFESTEEDEESSPRKRRKTEEGSYELRNSIDPLSRRINVECASGDTHIKLGNITMQLRRIANHPYLVHYPIDPDTNVFKVDENLISSSGKLLVMDSLLSRLKKRGHKVLVFCQMTTLMDILEDYMYLRGYDFVRLDGNKNMDQRQEAIETFSRKRECFIFLLSTRAGGLGINLTAADTVIMFESDWNPQVDLQAMDRCHRIGQNFPVMVYRLVTAGTIDDYMVKKATGKKRLEKMIIEKGKFKEYQQFKEQKTTLSLEDLRELFKSKDHQVRLQPNGVVFSDEELDSLLDRSDLLNQAEANTNL